MNRKTDFHLKRPLSRSESQWLQRVSDRLSKTLERDELVQQTTTQLQQSLGSDRVILYYFYRRWKGQVVCESLSSEKFSILGSTGADDCFNDEYAARYESGRCRAIADIAIEPVAECHREFLQSLQVQSNLVVPILIPEGLWGLLAVHYCQTPHSWTTDEIEQVRAGAKVLATASCISESWGKSFGNGILH